MPSHVSPQNNGFEVPSKNTVYEIPSAKAKRGFEGWVSFRKANAKQTVRSKNF